MKMDPGVRFTASPLPLISLYFPRKSGHIFLVVGYVKQVVFELFWRLIIE